MSKRFNGIYKSSDNKDIHFNLKIVSDRIKTFGLSLYMVHSNNFIKIENQ